MDVSNCFSISTSPENVYVLVSSLDTVVPDTASVLGISKFPVSKQSLDINSKFRQPDLLVAIRYGMINGQLLDVQNIIGFQFTEQSTTVT